MLGVIFSSFNFRMCLLRSALSTDFFLRKSPLWFLKRSLNAVSTIPKYFLSGSVGADTTALYTVLFVKHLLSKCYLALYLQLHAWLLEAARIIIFLWKQ